MSAENSPSERYDWGSVPIGGGGYVTGIAVHPLEPDLVYVRTDVGGAYRWDAGRERWVPLLDTYGPSHSAYYSVDAIAVDPRNPDVVYAAVGRTVGAPSAVLRSADRGRSWHETGIRVGIYGNADYRWAGPRLAVDPRSGAVLFGTRDRGLWRSDDGFQFHRVESFPAVGTGSGAVRDGVDAVGVTFVAWDPTAGTDEHGASRRIYAGVFGDDRIGQTQGGIYVSDDGGATWRRIPGSPLRPVRAAVDRDGLLFASHTEGVVRCSSGGCTEIAPSPGAYSGITVDPNRPGLVMAAERSRTPANPIYLSIDGGESWRRVEAPVQNRTAEPPWWPDTFFGSATSTLTLDPHFPGRAWLTDWFGVWRTEDVFAPVTSWRSYERGHEEVVVHALTSPPEGRPLISGVADVAGFLHAEELDRFPVRDERLPSNRSAGGVQDINSIAFFEGDPRYLYMAGNIRSQPVGRAFRSTDYGASWEVIDPAAISTLPDEARGGRIAVSSVDPDRIVWLPLGMVPYFSTDGGRTWQQAEGVTNAGIVPDVWNPSVYLTSNTTGVEVFYIYSPASGLLRSRDGVRFESVSGSGLPRTTARYTFIHAAPGVEGEVWVSMDREGLYRSVDFGTTFEKVEGVQQALLFGFGKGMPGAGAHAPYAAYIYGRANGDAAQGVYRSDDGGRSWIRISSPDVLFGAGPKVLIGDRQVFGRVYIGTGGRGIFVGEPSPAYAELSVGGARARIGAFGERYEIELPFGVDRMPPVTARLLGEEAGRVLERLVGEVGETPLGRAGERTAQEVAEGAGREATPGTGTQEAVERAGQGASESAAALEAGDGEGPVLRVAYGSHVPGTIVVELLDAGGTVLHRAAVSVYAADRPDVRVELGGRRLPLDGGETPTVRGEVPLLVEVAGPPSMIGRVEAALVPVRGGGPVYDERKVVFESAPGVALPGAITLDTERYDDGAYDLSVRVDTALDSSVLVEQRLLIDNWEILEEAFLPTERSAWFGSVKRRRTVEESDGWEEAAGDASEYFGDGNRLAVRTGAQNPYLVWEAERLARFELTLYAAPSNVSERIVISVSDGEGSWVDLPFEAVVEDSGGDRVRLRLYGGVPRDLDVRRFRVLLVTGAASPAGPVGVPSLELGHLTLVMRAPR